MSMRNNSIDIPQGSIPMPTVSLKQDRRSAVALLFAILAVPIIGLVGLAIDYGLWNQTYASLSLAASGAALNAVKTTAAAELTNDPNAVAEGQAAGAQWFVSQVGSSANAARLNISASQVDVKIKTGVQVTAKVKYASTHGAGYVTPIFGQLFGISEYPLSVTAAAAIGTAPYLDVEILLDNSPSMEIGATPNDIAYVMGLSTCSPYGGTWPQSGTYVSGQPYSVYDYSGYNSEAAELNAPFGVGTGGYTGVPGSATLVPANTNGGPACGPTASAGPPCAFACHFDTDHPAGMGVDFFTAARTTINQSNPRCYSTKLPANCQITLRFDLVKAAVNDVVSTMQQDDLPINNLRVGIFSFADSVLQIYPSPNNCGTPGSEACQADDNWSDAASLVGSYPTAPGQPEQGIQPVPVTAKANGTGDTDFQTVMTTLYQQYLTTPSGPGTSKDAPAKVLFLVTDGVADSNDTGSRTYGAFDPSLCNYYKNTLGYQIYVVYTPYYSLMNNFYLTNIMGYTEPLATSPVATNLAACTTNASTDFVVADPNNPNSINAALQQFLALALNSAARFTQ
jgi:Flp pilus assembly protein TadG